MAQIGSRAFALYTTLNGLSSSDVTSVLQDSDGYIWVGTSNGLNNFNAYQFKSFKSNPMSVHSLANNGVKCLYEGRDGNIWIGLRDGYVCRYDKRMEVFTNYFLPPHAVSRDGDVSAISEAADGSLWMAVDRLGLVRLNPKTGKVLQFEEFIPDNNSLSHNAVTDVLVDDKGFVWVTTWGGGLNRFDTKHHRFKHYLNDPALPDQEACRHLVAMCKDSQGYLWIGSTHAGAYRINLKTNQMVHYGKDEDGSGLLDNTVMDIAEDAKGNVWIVSGSGLCIFDKKTQKFSYRRAGDSANKLVTNDVRSIYRDHQGRMWLATSKGLSLSNDLHPRFDSCLPEDHSDHLATVKAILKDKLGRVWMNTVNHTWRIWPNGRLEDITTVVPHSQLRALYEDRSGNVWMGFYGSYVTRYSPETDRYEQIDLNKDSQATSTTPFRSVSCFYEDRDGTMWIGAELGLMRYLPKTGQLKSLIRSSDLIFPNEKVTSIVRDSYGELWVGTEGGLRRYNKRLQLVKIYTTKSGGETTLNSNVVTSLYEDRDRRLWVGTMNGLMRFSRENDAFIPIAWPNMQLGTPVMAIVEDKNGYLWLSSVIGLISYNPDKNDFHFFDGCDGVQDGEFCRGVVSKSRDGELLFGGLNGSCRFYPDKLRLNRKLYKVYIEDLQVLNQSVAPGENSPLRESLLYAHSVELSHDQSTLSLSFSVHDFTAPQKILYAYQLGGVDNDWIYTSANHRYATYAHLSPGKYVFRVKACNSDGLWNEQPTELEIIVRPPVWLTWWAKLIYLLLSIAAVYAVFRYYQSQVEARNQHMIQQLEAKQQHEMDELKFQLFTNISHEFRTSLTLILGPLEYVMNSKEMRDESVHLLNIIRGNAIRLTRLVSQLLDFRKVEARKLTTNKVTQDIVPFLRNVFEIFQYYARQQELSYEFHTTFESLTFDFDEDKVDKIVYNLLSNAFKYTKPGGKVVLSVDYVVDEGKAYVEIDVEDNGVGIPQSEQEEIFKLFFQASDNGQKYRGGSGLGLNMTKELVELMGGRITVESQPGVGSIFKVLLPMDAARYEGKNMMVTTVASADTAITSTAKTAVGKDSRDCVLIVDDNADMREYVVTVLGDDYQVVVGRNGREGLEIAVDKIPDIIITDIMMPEMDGLQLFEALRNNKCTEHIPVVMLTAVNEEQQIVEGFQMGVDEYMTKPFSAPVLRARIANILAKRKERWQQLRTNSVEPSNEYVEKYVNPFVEKLEFVIREHLADPALGVDMLASHFNMSSQQLNRKTKSLMDATPYSLIIRLRMETAVELMKQNELNVTEIAYKCGYQEVSNFSRSFTKFWGESPAQYIKKIRTL